MAKRELDAGPADGEGALHELIAGATEMEVLVCLSVTAQTEADPPLAERTDPLDPTGRLGFYGLENFVGWVQDHVLKTPAATSLPVDCQKLATQARDVLSSWILDGHSKLLLNLYLGLGGNLVDMRAVDRVLSYARQQAAESGASLSLLSRVSSGYYKNTVEPHLVLRLENRGQPLGRPLVRNVLRHMAVELRQEQVAARLRSRPGEAWQSTLCEPAGKMEEPWIEDVLLSISTARAACMRFLAACYRTASERGGPPVSLELRSEGPISAGCVRWSSESGAKEDLVKLGTRVFEKMVDDNGAYPEQVAPESWNCLALAWPEVQLAPSGKSRLRSVRLVAADPESAGHAVEHCCCPPSAHVVVAEPHQGTRGWATVKLSYDCQLARPGHLPLRRTQESASPTLEGAWRLDQLDPS